MAERRVIYLVMLCGGLVFYWAYREWLSWFLLVLMLVIPWLSLVLSWQAMGKLEVLVRCPDFISQGQGAAASLVGKCALPHPVVKGRMRITQTVTGKTWIQRNGEALPAEHCSELVIEPAKVWVYDYLGLFRRAVRHKTPSSMLVRPHPVPMDNPPDLSRYLVNAWKPKPGGGFAENHELRLYRPGDNLRQMHWKLSAKTGKLIIREPMEPLQGRAVLSMILRGTQEQMDRKLGQLFWLSGYLLEQGVPHEFHCLTGQGMCEWTVQNPTDTQSAIDGLLRCPQAAADAQFDYISAAWRYHVGGDGDEA